MLCFSENIDGDEFEVYGEDSNGREGSATISITELAADAAKLLAAQEAELQEYRKAAQPLSDSERQELIMFRNEDTLRRQQWAQSMQQAPTFGGILPKL